MNKDMTELCAWAVDQAKKSGADDCKVTVSRTRSVEVSYRERKPETIKEATSQSLSLHVYADGRYAAQSTSDLRRQAAAEFMKNAVTTTKLLAKDPYRSLPDPRYYEGRARTDLKLTDPSYPRWTPEQRHAAVKSVEDSCFRAGGDRVISVTASTQDQYYESAVMSSNGLQGYLDSTEYWFIAEMTARDEGDRRPTGYYYVGSRDRRSLPDPSVVGKTAAARTLAMLGGKKLKTATLPIIIENQSVPRVLGGLLEALFASNVQQKRSFLADRKGQRIGSERLTLIDDPLLIGGLGSTPYDSDGFATCKRTLVESGVLKDFLVDWYYSRKLSWQPTTGDPSNLLIPAGKRSVAEIMKDVGRGILVTEFIGGNSNSTTGDFSVGIGGTLFENGQPSQAVAEMNIADNHLKFWTKLAEAANDPWIYGSWRTPSLLFSDVVVSGV
jgi:PmbA protein